MQPDRVLAEYEAQVRRAVPPDGPGGVVTDDGEVVRSVVPLGHGGSYISWSRLTAGRADAAIAAQVEFFAARGQSVEWTLYDYDQPADLPARLVAAGFTAEETEALMVAEAAEAAGQVPLPAGVTLVRLTGAEGVRQLTELSQRVFGEPKNGLRRRLLAQLDDSPPSFDMVAALAGEEPVSGARVEYPAGTDFAGLWGGGTLPRWRGRGLYRALVARRAALAVARGYRYVQVDAQPTSEPILARLGFARLARMTPYTWTPPGTLPEG